MHGKPFAVVVRGLHEARRQLGDEQAIRDGNQDVGGRVIESAETEFMVRGHGYLKSAADIGNIVLSARGGTPVLLKDVARVEIGPDARRGIAELDGEGETVGGISYNFV